MGGRGAFDPDFGRTGGIPLENRKYSCIGVLGHIKIIQCDAFKNNPTTTYSNTCNTTYYSYSKESGKIEHIYYFRNHRLVRSVDFKDGEIPHAHKWNSNVVGRKSHQKSNIYALTPRDLRLVRQAQEYNRAYHG